MTSLELYLLDTIDPEKLPLILAQLPMLPKQQLTGAFGAIEERVVAMMLRDGLTAVEAHDRLEREYKMIGEKYIAAREAEIDRIRIDGLRRKYEAERFKKSLADHHPLQFMNWECDVEKARRI